ncbi:acyloxyacyl hydrolase [Corallincola luteus]|uniref:Acyloxyacyl hydrolase n=1 Tax=Corallincola luteus TaxID=1775177 RepID=A0ABY2ALA9_9GAMM|nr:acyloxyacyl hydrolase [Corallincola luteus]TCI03298.1 acyloxyacyl hydrolase [Corallincola luteus]
MKIAIYPLLLISMFLFSVSFCKAKTQLLLNAGGGPQPGGSQTNYTAGADLIFWQYERSSRQTLFLGTGITYLGTDEDVNEEIYAISVFPQLNLYTDKWGENQPYFFVRALGPTYLSSRKLGEREQGKRFAFQAQVGAGVYFGANESWLVSVSYKHFSNANLFSPNDGLDVPILLSLGRRW